MKRLVMFHGERAPIMGKIYQLFKDKAGKEYRFTGIKHVWFGELYVVENNSMKVRPERVAAKGFEPTEKDRLEYEAQKLVVRAQRQKKADAMKIARPHADIVKAVALLRPFYLPLSNIDRHRFMSWFENEISKRKKK